MSAHRHDNAPARLRIDPVACDGVSICSHVAPNLITVDSWGYPILASRPLSRSERRSAESAVKACPRKALFIERQVNSHAAS